MRRASTRAPRPIIVPLVPSGDHAHVIRRNHHIIGVVVGPLGLAYKECERLRLLHKAKYPRLTGKGYDATFDWEVAAEIPLLVQPAKPEES